MAQPDADEGIDDDQLLRDFDDWVQRLPSGWGQILRLFQDAKSSGVDGSGGLTRAEFIKQLNKKGYRNEDYLNEIFDQILEEEGTKQKQHVADLTDTPYEPEIYYTQVVRFQKRIQYLKCSLGANEDQSPTAEFVRMLMRKCGSTLRGWRLLLDLRSTGRIAYNDFTVACRKLGVAAQAKHVWNNAKEDGSLTLELHELDPKEGQNLEKFAEVLWYSFGLDLQKAWQHFDIHGMKFIDLKVFGKAARGIGFEGNVKMLFKGLDAAGLGKVKESDFLYIAKVSRLASKKLGTNGRISQVMADLLTWTQRELGGPHELIAKLELGSDGHVGVPVAELAARISALGFEGDSMDVATEAARSEDGTFVSAECLYTLLTTGRATRPTLPVPPPPPPIRPSMLAAFGPSTSSSPSSPRKKKVRQVEWQSNVDNFSDSNKVRCKYTRGYFSPPNRPTGASRPVGRPNSSPASCRSQCLTPHSVVGFRQEATLRDGRPAWNSSTVGTEAKNEANSPYCREYFSDSFDRPVRDLQRSHVERSLSGTMRHCW